MNVLLNINYKSKMDLKMNMKLNFPLALLICVFSLHISAAEVGQSAPNINLNLLKGKVSSTEKIGIRDYRGKLVYLDFWASWCGPCRQSLPILNEIRGKFKSKGFEVVAVNVDENLADALKFLSKYPVDYPILLDPNGSMPGVYQIKGMPTAYLIDDKGKIIYKHVGFKKKDRKKIEKLIRLHLAKR